VGNDALLPTQNTISRVGKFKSRGVKLKKKLALLRRTVSYPPSSKMVPAPMRGSYFYLKAALLFMLLAGSS